jgi:hypothetical protein
MQERVRRIRECEAMFTRSASALIVSLFLLCCTLPAQQPNSPGASLLINGTNGPPFPIANVLIQIGFPATLQIQGDPNTPVVLASAPQLMTPSTPFLGGLVDLDTTNPAAISVPFNGFAWPQAGFVTDGSGSFLVTFPSITVVQPNYQIAYQALVQNAASPFGMRLTAATSVVIFSGVTVVPLTNLGFGNTVQVNTLTQYGFLMPFYGTAYSECWISGHGFINFLGPDTDFTPSNLEMHINQPRIAPFWSDLQPNHPVNGGSVTLTVDQTDPMNPLMTVFFDSVPDWQQGSPPLFFHDVAAVLDIARGDIAIVQYLTNTASVYDMMIGISPGLSLDPTGAGSMDLSVALAAGPYMGMPNEGLYEGFMGMLSITGQFTAPYDLLGQKILFRAVNPGMAGASYNMRPLP